MLFRVIHSSTTDGLESDILVGWGRLGLDLAVTAGMSHPNSHWVTRPLLQVLVGPSHGSPCYLLVVDPFSTRVWTTTSTLSGGSYTTNYTTTKFLPRANTVYKILALHSSLRVSVNVYQISDRSYLLTSRQPPIESGLVIHGFSHVLSESSRHLIQVWIGSD